MLNLNYKINITFNKAIILLLCILQIIYIDLININNLTPRDNINLSRFKTLIFASFTQFSKPDKHNHFWQNNNLYNNSPTIVTYIRTSKIVGRQIDNLFWQNYVTDHKSSVLKLETAEQSNLQNYSYDAYGNVITSISPLNNSSLSSQVTTKLKSNNYRYARSLNSLAMTTENPFEYNGERFDSNTSLQYLHARFYSLEIKRFITEDNFIFLNRFSYASNNPIKYTDPTGHMIFEMDDMPDAESSDAHNSEDSQSDIEDEFTVAQVNRNGADIINNPVFCAYLSVNDGESENRISRPDYDCMTQFDEMSCGDHASRTYLRLKGMTKSKYENHYFPEHNGAATERIVKMICGEHAPEFKLNLDFNSKVRFDNEDPSCKIWKGRKYENLKEQIDNELATLAFQKITAAFETDTLHILVYKRLKTGGWHWSVATFVSSSPRVLQIRDSSPGSQFHSASFDNPKIADLDRYLRGRTIYF